MKVDPSRILPLAASVLLAGCAAISETADKLNPFSSATPKAKAAELKPIQASTELHTLWQASVGNAGAHVFTPAVVGESVFAAAHDGTIARFDGGRQVWRVSAGQKLSGGVGADGKRVVVATAKGEVLAFSAESGATLWTARASSEVLAAPVLGQDVVIVRSGDSRLTAFEAADGKRRWSYQRNTPALTLRSHAGVVLADRLVIAGFPGGKMAAISLQNGVEAWEVAVALPKGATELERVADVASMPRIDGRDICAAAFQRRIACFDHTTGNLTWGRDISSSAGLDMDAQRVYVSDDDGSVHAFARDTGASLWKQDALSRRSLSRPLALGAYVAVADYQGVVHLLKADSGAFAARAVTDGSAVLADPGRVGDALLVQTRNGSLVALGRR